MYKEPYRQYWRVLYPEFAEPGSTAHWYGRRLILAWTTWTGLDCDNGIALFHKRALPDRQGEPVAAKGVPASTADQPGLAVTTFDGIWNV
jgi:hypothetical protein